jgi:hypothetical protein
MSLDRLEGFLLKILLDSSYLIAALIYKDSFGAPAHFTAITFFDELPDCKSVGGRIISPFNSLWLKSNQSSTFRFLCLPRLNTGIQKQPFQQNFDQRIVKITLVCQ